MRNLASFASLSWRDECQRGVLGLHRPALLLKVGNSVFEKRDKIPHPEENSPLLPSLPLHNMVLFIMSVLGRNCTQNYTQNCALIQKLKPGARLIWRKYLYEFCITSDSFYVPFRLVAVSQLSPSLLWLLQKERLEGQLERFQGSRVFDVLKATAL